MTLLLAGDIGGTKTILRLVKVVESEKNPQKLYEAIYPSANFPDLVPMVQQFLSAAGKEYPSIACFAIAGPVQGNTSNLTNLNWSLNSQRLETELGIEEVSLINDFAAVSYGILGLKDSEKDTLQPGAPSDNSPIAVIGAGTGLGQGFLVSDRWSNYQVFATEGGHADFAPRHQLEFEMLTYLKNKYKTDRVSVERVVSGQGIVAIYQFLRDIKFAPESPKVGEMIRQWEEEKTVEHQIDPAAIIARSAQEKQDLLSEKTMEMFVEAYGAEAGNLALKLLPYGGMYIAGGIAAKILPLMKQGRFLSAFKQKGRVSNLLEKVPVHVVLNPQVGLLGSVLYALRSQK